MSRKQEIYREFLQFGLPYLRSVRSLRWRENARRRDLSLPSFGTGVGGSFVR